MKIKALFFLFLSLTQLHADSEIPVVRPHLETYRNQKDPFGNLGLPLGTFAVIEGTCHAPASDNSHHNFTVNTVNGQKLSRPIEITTPDWGPTLKPGKRYVVHGFENGGWRGSPPLPVGESTDIWDEPLKKAPPFSFVCEFHLTSVEYEDGVPTQDACPVDPSFHLAKPDFSPHIITPPLGVTGLPLGTYMAITIGAARDPVKDRAAELFAINGKPVAQYTAIHVPSLLPPTGSTKIVVHGYESGDWNGLITAPASESKADAMHNGPPRVPDPNSISFICYFLVTNWTDRTPRPSIKPSASANPP